jgi:predicted nucleic acid-binding protein
MNYKTSLPIAALAAAALALPATAAASEAPPWSLIPVPTGEVQHTVTETTFASNETVPGVTPWDRIQEDWASATARDPPPVSAAIADDTALLKARQRGLSLPDAITLVIAELIDADSVWTFDRRWRDVHQRVAIP